MGRIVIVGYKPKEEKESELQEMLKLHLSTLRAEALISDRDSIVMRSTDGTIVEVFEWASKESIEAAHNNPKTQQMWEEFSKVCDFIPVSQVPESASLFSEFTPLN